MNITLLVLSLHILGAEYDMGTEMRIIPVMLHLDSKIRTGIYQIYRVYQSREGWYI